MVEFADFSPEEDEAVERIVIRAMSKFPIARRFTPMTIRMDLAAVHAKIPLRLEELANADALDFVHDVGGIVGNMNRETGELENCFVPRFAR